MAITTLLAAASVGAAACSSGGEPAAGAGSSVPDRGIGRGTVTAAPATTSPPATIAPPPDGVAIAGFRFTPPDLVVAPGATVTFRNDDNFEHKVERLDTGEASPELRPGDTWTFVASTADGSTEIPYYCAIHNTMRARVRIG